jgi:hypothetical protein
MAGSPWSFDPVLVGRRECAAWAAYYRREWRPFLVAAVGMVRAGFGMRPPQTLYGAFLVLRANQLWAPYPLNDADGARDCMRRFYALVRRELDLDIDPAEAARREVEWWRVHREVQREPDVGQSQRDELVEALVQLYRYVYGTDPEAVQEAAEQRARAMDLSDAWVAAGCDLDDPRLRDERLALVASYTALLDAVGTA